MSTIGGNQHNDEKKVSLRFKYRDGSKLFRALNNQRQTIKPKQKIKILKDTKEWKEYLPGKKKKQQQQQQEQLYDDDETIVLGLPQDMHSTTRNHQCNDVIMRLEARRRMRHDNEWRVYIEWKKSLNDELEEKVFDVSQHHRRTMMEMEESICKELNQLVNDELLNELDSNAFQQIWQNVQQQFDDRTKCINEFKDKLQSIECQRRQRFDTTIQRLIERLIEIAHLLRNDIQRLVECECNEMNTMMIRNHHAIDECISNMNEYQSKLRDRYYDKWKHQREEWCRMRYEKLINDVIHELTTHNEWTRPMDRRIVYDYVINEQTQIYNESMNQLVTLIAMQPPMLNRDNVETIHKIVMNLYLRFNEMCDKCVNDLTTCHQSITQRYENRLQLLTNQLSTYRTCSMDDERMMIEQRVTSVWKKRNDMNTRIMDRISHVLHIEDVNLHKRLQLMIDIYNRASTMWETFLHELDELQNKCTDELDGRRDTYNEHIQGLERKLQVFIDHLRHAPSIQGLESMYNDDICRLIDEMQSVHVSFYNQSIDMVSKHSIHFTQLFQRHCEILFNFVGVYANHQLNDDHALDRAMNPHLYDNNNKDDDIHKKLESPSTSMDDDGDITYGPMYDAIELGYVHKSASQRLYVVKSTIRQQYDEWMNSIKRQHDDDTTLDTRGDGDDDDEYIRIYELDTQLMIQGFMNLRQSFVNGMEEIESLETERIRQTNEHRIQLLTEECDLVLRKHRPRLTTIMTNIKYKRQCELSEKMDMFHRHWDRIKNLCATKENEIKTYTSSIQMMIQLTNDEIGTIIDSMNSVESMSMMQRMYNRYQNCMKSFHTQTQRIMTNDIDASFNELCVNGRQMVEHTTDGDDDEYRKEWIIISQQLETCIESQHHSIEAIKQSIKQFASQSTFDSIYNQRKEYVSMYNGLGHHYGAPKRCLSTHLRNEFTQNHHLFNEIDGWCQSLETIVHDDCNTSITLSCIRTLWKLRRMFDRRGRYLQVLDDDNVSDLPQISLIDDDGGEQILENGEEQQQTTYHRVIESIDATCRQQMNVIVQQYYTTNPQYEALTTIPLPIQEHFDKEKVNALMKYKQFRARYRDLVIRTTDVCDRLPKIVMNDILCTSKRQLNDAIREMNETFGKREIEWKNQHQHNEFMLKPYLMNPLMKNVLNDLMAKEQNVHEQTIGFISDYGQTVLNTLRLCANRFIKRLQHTSTTLILLFDSIITIHHLKSSNDDHDDDDQRNDGTNVKQTIGLKRLIRKSNRIQQHQNSSSSSSSKSSKKATSPSSNRLDKCQYPELNISDLTSLLDHHHHHHRDNDTSIETTPNDGMMMTSIPMIECSNKESNRMVVHQRNRVYQLYNEYFTQCINQIMNRMDKERNDEFKWRENWNQFIQNLHSSS